MLQVWFVSYDAMCVTNMLSAIAIECVFFCPLTLIEKNNAGMPMIIEVMLKIAHRIKNTTVTVR